jgi:hypothetical protein
MSIEHELCFVWGPPLVGQRTWMLRSAQASPPEVEVRLLLAPDRAELGPLLRSLEAELARAAASERSCHIYCELPWDLLLEDFALEDWLQQRPEFTGEKPTWGLGFIGLLPPDLHRLPQEDRTLIENFGRASLTEIIVVRESGDRHLPLWVESKSPDFGKKVSLYEEDLWASPIEALEKIGGLFEEESDLEDLNIPVLQRPTEWEALMRLALNGRFGMLWGAEVSGLGERNLAPDLSLPWKGFVVTQGALYRWEETVRGLVDPSEHAMAQFRLRGQHLDREAVSAELKRLGLWADA